MKAQTFTLVCVVLIASGVAMGKYSGGTGEPDNPYQISDANDMNEIGANPDDWDAHFVMVNDVNLADYTGTEFNIIGNDTTPFSGVFDGNSHTISNFTYDSNNTNYIGLFGYIDDPNAVIKDLTLTDPNVNATGYANHVGSLAGYLGYGTIMSCGIMGSSVYGSQFVGGLVGSNEWGTISSSYATGGVEGYYGIGGLVGYNDHTISSSYATGRVLGVGCTGGLVGDNFASISNCYAIGKVSGDYHTGGLVGYNTYSSIWNCYAKGDVSGEQDTGGLVGCNYGAISNCYATARVWGYNFIGGLVGVGHANDVTTSFWDIETSGTTYSYGGIGKTTTEMQTESTFTNAGWDFVEIWNIGENQTYPYLRVYPAGDLSHDGIVNFVDVAILADHWLEGTEP